jgi:predicted nucleotide-binding protein (sugar kinase/HSP70/actin superfamily)
MRSCSTVLAAKEKTLGLASSVMPKIKVGKMRVGRVKSNRDCCNKQEIVIYDTIMTNKPGLTIKV